MSTISGVSSSGDAWANMKAQRSQMQAKMFAKVDTDSSAGVDQTELQSMLDDMGKATGTTHSTSTQELFTQMDANSDGSLSSDELEKGMKDVLPPPSTIAFAQSRSADNAGEQDNLFAKIDANSDGAIDQTELKAMTDKIKADTGQDAGDLFTQLDTDSDGKLTSSEFEAGRPTNGIQGAEGPQGGPPPAGGPGGAGGAGKSNSSSTTYDKLDTNQDGTVSEMERLAGAIKDLAASATTGDQASTDSLAADKLAELVTQVYEKIAQGLAQPSTGNTVNAMA